MARPDWWPDWLPETCAEGHRYDDGVSLSWESCPNCPAAPNGGHHVWYCRVDSCRAEPARPPGHIGGTVPQR